MYLAYFEVNSDGDFGFTDYKNLNYHYKLFNTVDEAEEVIKKHFKTCIDTFRTSRDYIKHIKDDMLEVYNNPAWWERNPQWIKNNDYMDDYIIDIWIPMGNQEVHYWVQRVDLFGENNYNEN